MILANQSTSAGFLRVLIGWYITDRRGLLAVQFVDPRSKKNWAMNSRIHFTIYFKTHNIINYTSNNFREREKIQIIYYNINIIFFQYVFWIVSTLLIPKEKCTSQQHTMVINKYKWIILYCNIILFLGTDSFIGMTKKFIKKIHK